MSVLSLIVILCCLAGLYWLINFKFGDKVVGPFKFLINLVLIVVAIVLVLYAFGILGEIKSVQVPKL